MGAWGESRAGNEREARTEAAPVSMFLLAHKAVKDW